MSVFWTIVKSTITAFSFTLMMLAVVYTQQSRAAREAAPKRIGEVRVEKPFLVEYTETRQAVVMDYLRRKFPDLDLPQPEAPPTNSLSLEALRDRTIRE